MYKFFTALFKSLAVIVLLAAISWGLLAGYRWVTTTELLSVQNVKISGNQALSSSRVKELAGISQGKNIFAMDIGEMERNIRSSEWVEALRIKRDLPDTLHLKIQEKEPVFWIRKEDRLFYADSQGRAIAPVQAERFRSLPFLSVKGSSSGQKERLRQLREEMRARDLPFTLQDVSWLRFFPGQIMEIRLHQYPLRIYLGGQGLQENLGLLETVWSDLQGREELSRVKRIRIYNATGWVEKAPGESL